MKITRVKAHPMTMPLDKVYWTSRAPWGTYNTIVVTVETDAGVTGLGFINKTPLKDIAEIVDALARELPGYLVPRLVREIPGEEAKFVVAAGLRRARY